VKRPVSGDAAQVQPGGVPKLGFYRTIRTEARKSQTAAPSSAFVEDIGYFRAEPRD